MTTLEKARRWLRDGCVDGESSADTLEWGRGCVTTEDADSGLGLWRATCWGGSRERDALGSIVRTRSAVETLRRAISSSRLGRSKDLQCEWSRLGRLGMLVEVIAFATPALSKRLGDPWVDVLRV
jgi:hypothetical protein